MVINIRQGTEGEDGFVTDKNVRISRRELETLVLIGMGFSNAEAAGKMSISLNTIRSHVWNLMQKMGAKSRANAIVIAVQNGLLDIPHKRSLGTYVPGVDRFVLCIYCGNVSLEADYKEETTEKVTINHIEYEIPILPECPTKDCDGNITETIDWDYIRQYHNEYPAIPEKGVKYDYEIEWYHGYPG